MAVLHTHGAVCTLGLAKRDLWGLGAETWFIVASYAFGGGEICIRVNLSTVQWVYLYTFFSNFRGQNRGEICIHMRSKQG